MAKRPMTDITALTYQQWGGDRKPVNPKRAKIKLDPTSVQKAYLSSCCPKRCLNGFSMELITACRRDFWGKTPKQQRAFIYASVKSSLVDGLLEFVVEGQRLCEKGWMELYGVADRRYRGIKMQIREKRPTEETARKPTQPSRRLLQADTWLRNYAQHFGERQPDREEIHLPKCLSKEAIYGLYSEEMVKAKEPTLSLSAFRDMWLKRFRHLKISTGKSGQPTCTPCTNAKATMMLKTVSDDVKKENLEKRDFHLNLQSTCRSKYYKHIKKSKENPGYYVSIIIDNMDQAKTRLPGFKMYSKADAHLCKMQHHITGVKVHNLDRNFIFTWTDVFHPDVNITLNCLVHVLGEVSKANDGHMPTTLYLQADNCVKDNKNAFLMMFLTYLIKQKIFKKIKLNFLMVGHTHEDVDQMFSRISSRLAKVDAHTLPQLKTAVQSSTTPPPEVIHLKSIWDFRAALIRCKGLIRFITSPHVFKFVEVEERIKICYKDWPEDGEQYRQLDVTPFIPDLRNLPNAAVNAKVDETLRKMEEDLPKWAASGRLENTEIEWWRRYLAGCRRETRLRPDLLSLHSLGRYHVPAREPVAGEEAGNLIAAIRRNHEKERKRTVLTLTRKAPASD